MTKKINRKQLNGVIMAISHMLTSNNKNIIGLRCERIGKIVNDISKELNAELSTIDEEYASKDKDQNFLREEVVITDKNGSSKKENIGAFKYTFTKEQERKKAIADFWGQDIELPCNVVKRELHKDLYKKIIEENSFTTLSNLAGIILDIPLGADGFIDEEWILEFLSSNKKTEQNGQAHKKELEGATA